jgi:hypothetical protein
MSPSSLDLTDLALAARTNDPRVVEAFGRKFGSSKLHLPLATLDGIKNHPETAVELGARLPVHWLRLDNGEIGVPLFTRLTFARGCAERLSWKTDGRALRTLALPGKTAVAYLKELLVSPDVERVILNPLDDSELHLSRTDVSAIASGKTLRRLWFYQRHGQLKVPVTIEGAGSLLGSLLTRADRVIHSWTERDAPSVEEAVEAVERKPRFEELEEPLRSLARRIYQLLDEAGWTNVDLTVTKTKKDVQVKTVPISTAALAERARRAAIELLADEPAGAIRFQLREGVMVVSSSVETKHPEPPARTRVSPKRSAAETLRYIPLEPEPLDDD